MGYDASASDKLTPSMVVLEAVLDKAMDVLVPEE